MSKETKLNRAWATPDLIVISRALQEERVLEGCKGIGSGSGAAGNNSGCWLYSNPSCYNCSATSGS